MATRDHLVLYLNGQRREIRGGDCFLSLSDYLRHRCRLVGTKIVCSEGDCGSCTVLVGRPELSRGGMRFRYWPIDSCIQFMFQLDGTHVVTIEGLSAAGAPTPIQQAMVDCHGSQCGFCTPGFVMAMTGVHENCNGHSPDKDEWRHALTGNLCRCTGYTSILQAGAEALSRNVYESGEPAARLETKYPSKAIANELRPLGGDTLDLRGTCDGTAMRAFCPTTIEEAIAFRCECPDAKIIAGATDVGVQINKRMIAPKSFLVLNRANLIQIIHRSEHKGKKTIFAGARVSWTGLLRAFVDMVPQFAEIISVFGSPQIRHVGTIGGNIINASPIADSLPFLFAMEAELELAGPSGRRRVNINDFYQGYKKFDLRSDELLTQVIIPLPDEGELLRLYKISRRRDLDISTFTAAIRIQLSGETIESASLAYGAVAPVVLRLRKTEQFLQGRPFSEETMIEAGEVAVSEIAPISDVRGSKEYRLQLARNVLLKFYHEQQLATV